MARTYDCPNDGCNGILNGNYNNLFSCNECGLALYIDPGINIIQIRTDDDEYITWGRIDLLRD